MISQCVKQSGNCAKCIFTTYHTFKRSENKKPTIILQLSVLIAFESRSPAICNELATQPCCFVKCTLNTFFSTKCSLANF